MVGEKKIYWNKRKYKPSVETILTWIECNDIEIYNAPLETFKNLMLHFSDYPWDIHENENTEKPMNIKTYLLNEDILTQGLPNIHYIFISTKQVRKPYAYAVLRKGD